MVSYSTLKEEMFVLPDLGAWFRKVMFRNSCLATCAVGHCRCWSRWPAYRSGGSVFTLNCHLFVTSYFCNFLSMTPPPLFFSWSKPIVCNHSPHFNMAFTGKSVNVRRLDERRWTRNHLRRPVYTTAPSITDTRPTALAFSCSDWGNSRTTSVTTVVIPAEIRDLSNTGQKS